MAFADLSSGGLTMRAFGLRRQPMIRQAPRFLQGLGSERPLGCLDCHASSCSGCPYESSLKGTGRPFRLLRGLGTGTKAGQTAGSIILTAGKFDPEPISKGILLAVGALTKLFSGFLGGGCGQACISAAMTEQIPEAAADNLYAAAKLGMISSGEAIAGMQALIQYGQQHEAALGGSHSAAGSKNLTSVINDVISATRQLPSSPTRAIDLEAARAVYIPLDKKGWYSESLAAAAQLSDAYLQGLASSRGAAPPSAGPVAAVVRAAEAQAAAAGISPLVLVALLGLGILAVMK